MRTRGRSLLFVLACCTQDDDPALAPDAGVDAPDTCIDADGDGYDNCLGLPDCDDDNRYLHSEEDCLRCEADPSSTGCPCPELDAVGECWTLPPEYRGVGECRVGHHTCIGHSWGSCFDEVWPQGEACDGLDNDCNGQVDESYEPGCESVCNCPPPPPRDRVHFAAVACTDGCELPPSVCDGRWLVYAVAGSCVDGRCAWVEGFEWCWDSCQDGGCYSSFT